MKKLRDSWEKAQAIGKTDKGDIHSYIEIYDLLFAGFAGRKTSILEIGVQYGGSLAMWKDYFQPGSVVHGVESHPIEWAMDGVEIFYGNAYTNEMVDALGSYDIVIDDGSHDLPDVRFFVDRYLSKVNLGGLLIVEDVQSEAVAQGLYGVVPPEYRPCSYIIDSRHAKGRYDDLLFVVCKKE
jgi:hypothetical protein